LIDWVTASRGFNGNCPRPTVENAEGGCCLPAKYSATKLRVCCPKGKVTKLTLVDKMGPKFALACTAKVTTTPGGNNNNVLNLPPSSNVAPMGSTIAVGDLISANSSTLMWVGLGLAGVLLYKHFKGGSGGARRERPPRLQRVDLS
jgi:hypothetical protein